VTAAFSGSFPFAFLGGRPRLFGAGATGLGVERSSQKLGEDGGEGEYVKSVNGLARGELIGDAMMLSCFCDLGVCKEGGKKS
jgi:hypothetical protein